MTDARSRPTPRKRPRRRRFIHWGVRAALCLLLGAVTTAGVALALPYRLAEGAAGMLESNGGDEAWGAFRFGGGEILMLVEPGWSSGIARAQNLPLFEWSTIRRSNGYRHHIVWEGAHGWPFRALKWQKGWDRESGFLPIGQASGPNRLYLRYSSTSARSAPVSLPKGSQYIIGTDVIFVGFILDTLFYGALWAILVVVPTLGWRAIKRWHRRRRGRCVSCGYDLAGLEARARCPECGA